MSNQVLDKLISGYMATEQQVYAFGWQGGEPTLMGLDFFRRVTDLQQKHGRPGSVISNGLQTNGTLLDDTFARHLHDYKFLVGVSLDGPADVHDHYRKRINGIGTHADVLRGIVCLRRNDVEFNILTLVNSANVTKGREIYRYLSDMGFAFHQYIPCVEFDESGAPQPWSISGEEWGEFLCAVFDEWYESDTRRVSVRLFDSILSYLVDGVRNICHMCGNCNQYFLIEHNGDVYPCDFFVEPDLNLGNVADHTWEEFLSSEKYHEFGLRKSAMAERCADCAFMRYCMGDCPKHRMSGNVSELCPGWKQFFVHSLPRFEELAGSIEVG
jgi:uncharacterized protein